MSYFGTLGFRDDSTDAFQRLRTSAPHTILDLKQISDGSPLFFDDAETEGSGTSSTYNTNQASTTLSVSATTFGKRVRQSKLRGTYQPGKSMLVLLSGIFGVSPTGVTKRMGYFDDKNGLFFERADGVTSVVRRTYTSGSAVDVSVAQDSWNIDPMDGTGPSGITLNFSKTQIFVIDFEWLGVGRVRFGVNVDGKFYYVHEMLHANALEAAYMGNPNLPVRYEIYNNGTGVASDLTAICASVVSEGGQEDVAASTYISRGDSAATLAATGEFTPILSVRLKSGYESVKVNPIKADLLATSSTEFEWRLVLNPDIAGTDSASWTSVANSGLEFDVTRDNTNLVTNGYVLAGGYGASSNQISLHLLGEVKSHLTLGTNIDGSSDELILAVAPVGSTGGTVLGGLTLGEYT